MLEAAIITVVFVAIIYGVWRRRKRRAEQCDCAGCVALSEGVKPFEAWRQAAWSVEAGPPARYVEPGRVVGVEHFGPRGAGGKPLPGPHEPPVPPNWHPVA